LPKIFLEISTSVPRKSASGGIPSRAEISGSKGSQIDVWLFIPPTNESAIFRLLRLYSLLVTILLPFRHS
jgi:hypothetical protein